MSSWIEWALGAASHLDEPERQAALAPGRTNVADRRVGQRSRAEVFERATAANREPHLALSHTCDFVSMSEQFCNPPTGVMSVRLRYANDGRAVTGAPSHKPRGGERRRGGPLERFARRQ